MRIVNPELTLDWLRTNFTGKGVKVAVIDSGIDASHPVLAGKIKQVCVVRPGDDGQVELLEQTGAESFDSYGHGTAVAGALLSVAPDVEIVSVKVLNEYNRGTGEALIAGLRWTLEQNIRLVNMSLATARKQYAERLYALAEQAYRQNTCIVASRRNLGDIGWPAGLLSVIGVDRDDFDDIMQFRYIPRSLIEFAAHGTNVQLPTLHQQYASWTGTSFATPHVTGVLALLIEAFPGILLWEVMTILRALNCEAVEGQ